MIKGLQNLLDYESRHPTISKIDVGESGWLVPWMFKMTREGDIFVNDTNLESEGGGTLEVLLTKTKDGFDVDFTNVKDHGIDVVDKEENLNDGVMGEINWIKVGNVKNEFLTSEVKTNAKL